METEGRDLWAPANKVDVLYGVGGARALLESALRAVHGLEVGLQAGEALRVQAARRQVQQLFSEEKDYYTVFSS